MNQKFTASINQKDDVTFVKLSGVIDEDNELSELVEQIPGNTTVIIGLGEIERINSCGVRDWVNWLTRLEKNGAKIVLVECSPAIVAQINLVNNFTGGGVVKSFFAPYFCPQCDLEKVLLVETLEMHGQNPPKAPVCRCDECDGVMDFDDMEESYFAFVNSAKKVPSDPKLNSLIVEFTNPGGSEGDRKIRSRVGSTTGGLPTGTGTQNSLPSVPSLPGRGSTSSPGASQSSGGFGGATGTGFKTSGTKGGQGSAAPLPVNVVNPGGATSLQPQKSMAVYVIVGLLVIAIALLVYAVFGTSTPPKPAFLLEQLRFVV